MHTYCKLKNGDIMIVWSNNTDEETMDLYPLSKKDTFDVEFDSLERKNMGVPYSDIERTDTNLSYLQAI